MGWIIFLLAVIGWHIGLYGMFKKAGIAPYKALIPFYNTWCLIEKIQVRRLWFWLQLIPIAGQFVTIWLTIIFVMHFGRFNVLHHAAVVFIPFLYLPYLGFSANERYAGHAVFANYKKPASREWIDAAVFAIVAATLIRSFLFEAYTIPTPSMEKTLLVNDFLFVNKVAYGSRIPQTPLSFPFVHNLMPFSQSPSYLKWIQLDYKRLPGYEKVERNDVVVFNFPMGDTVINDPEYGSKIPYYDVLRRDYKNNRDALMADWGDKILVHPMDKADNYIKRCVAIPGDTLQVKGSVLYIDGKPAYQPAGSQTHFRITTNGKPIDWAAANENLGMDIRWETGEDADVMNLNEQFRHDSSYIINLSDEDAELVKKLPNVTGVSRYIIPYTDLFPFDPQYNWSIDDYGPIWIPKAGTTIAINNENISLYERIISVYEHRTLERKNGQIIIDGKPATQYTFLYDYYWMMGDNRHNSQDSRFWGFVPATHIVGKASFIWFSWENGPRWKRIFSNIK